MKTKTFAPSGADTVQLAATAASASVSLDPNSSVVRVFNAGPNIAYLQFGGTGVTSTTAKMPIAAGNTELFTKGVQAKVAAICDTGNTATLFFTAGEGL
jgi:hypothetical protein